MLATAYTLHVLAAIIWVGGMFFAHMVLRPAALDLEPAQRLPLWLRAFGRFFPWVWASVVVLPTTGSFILHDKFGGEAGAPIPVHIMLAVGWIMIVLFLILFFGPYRGMKRAMAAGDLPAAARRQGQVRLIVTINLVLGLAISALVVAGRWW